MQKPILIISLLLVTLGLFSTSALFAADPAFLSSDSTTSRSVKAEEMEDSLFVRKRGKWFRNPSASRYLIMPSAIGLKKGEGYYQNSYLTLNSAFIGVNDYITVGGGLELISTMLGSPIVYGTVKASAPISKNLHVGGGVLYMNIFSREVNFSGLGVGYGMVTVGNENHNLTVGTGWGFFDGEFSDKPMITISGMTRISKRFGLVTENWIVPTPGAEQNYYPVFSYAGRIMTPKVVFDVGFVNTRDIASVLPVGVPYVDVVFKFGGKKK